MLFDIEKQNSFVTQVEITGKIYFFAQPYSF